MSTQKPSRRRFLKISGIAALGWSLVPASFDQVFAKAPFAYPLHNIPPEKGLDPKWIRSLYERGKPTTYLKSRNELQYIGMPAGGLHAGTVYLGGDGRLWLWSIYNDDREGVDPKTVLWNDGSKEVKVRSRDGANYIEPSLADNKRVLEQGFAIRIETEDKTIIKELKETDWQEVAFEATYPAATIRYTDKNVPVDVVVRAGGIFIPLDADNSAIPATVFSIHLENKSGEKIKAAITGWMENGAHKLTAKAEDGVRQNKIVQQDSYSAITGAFSIHNPEAIKQRDAGTTCITYVGEATRLNTDAHPWPVDEAFFTLENREMSTGKEAGDKLVGSICTEASIEAGGHHEARFIISWHFNHGLAKLDRLNEIKSGYYYGRRFKDASAVGIYVAQNFEKLFGQTLLWQQTYYDATLPHWFLERTLLNIGTLATANTYRFANDRFWGWEGVNTCEGTCTHVWQYAQAMGRLFPSLERDVRQRTDMGIALQENGGIIFRAEYETRPAIDGQAGTILRMYREHQVSADDQFLKRNWEQVKKAARFLLAQDKNGDGMTDTPMENTLDAVWEGEIAWIVGLCIAAVKAAQRMAEEMNDQAFAKTCKTYVEKGCQNMASHLFNGEYFIHRPDPAQGRKKLGAYNTCHIDQVYGQSWAFQVGLGRLWDREKTRSALRALWKYNFAPDVGPYIKTHTGGRPYALPGEPGMVMNTNPQNEAQPYGEDITWQLGYFHECMSGFEHQVASHMMAEGMTDEALVLTRAIHDRYHASRRNPFNEIECSDHYARAMASYGTFITACGFEYHGPKGYMRFAPAWNKDHFKAAFTAAEGWGSYEQHYSEEKQQHHIYLKYGSLQLNMLRIEKENARSVAVKLNDQPVAADFHQYKKELQVSFKKGVLLREGQVLTIDIA